MLVLLFSGCELDDDWFFPKTKTQEVTDIISNKSNAVDSTPKVRAVIKEHQDKLEAIKLDSVFKTALYEQYKYIEARNVEADSIKAFYHNKLDSLHMFYKMLDMNRQAIYDEALLKIHNRMLVYEINIQKKLNTLDELKAKYDKMNPNQVKVDTLGAVTETN